MKTRSSESLGLLFLVILFSFSAVEARSDREEWQPPGRIMDAVGVKPGMVIGELGAGSGYMTFYLAERVGKEGLIYANDISQSALEEITSRAKREGVGNIKTVMGEIEDPVLPVKDPDMLIMVYVLHMLDRPMEFMENVKKYMTAETPLVIIERNTTRERAHPPSFMTNREILETMQETGYILERTETFLPKDTIYIYRLKKPKD